MEAHGLVGKLAIRLSCVQIVSVRAASSAGAQVTVEFDGFVGAELAIELSGTQFSVVVARHSCLGRSAVDSGSRAARMVG
jgi:hypothetical protein